ncbi:sperm acrosome-associated protein 7-like [Dipodomys merriami]|uniref:sperm acrosome-associated protein 7-like n=1 Tax=Dipodomys merriami TaxID=94247 RepID=UPI0038556CB2
MAASRRVWTLSFVLLLCSWRQAEPQPIQMTADEILIQELLDPSKSAFETESTASTLSTKQLKEENSGIDDNYQGDGAENYHELLESSELSSGNEERNYNTGGITTENLHGQGPENFHEPRFSSGEKKDPKNDRYGRLSILDKILQNIGRSSGSGFQ